MPRGIPNKKKTTETSAAPKRRGRPPGSKNAAKTASTPQATPVHAVVSKAAVTYKTAPKSGVEFTSTKELLATVRANVQVLGLIPSAAGACQDQIALLLKLTKDISHEDEVVEVVNHAPSATHTAPAMAALPTPPSFVAPPFPGQS